MIIIKTRARLTKSHEKTTNLINFTRTSQKQPVRDHRTLTNSMKRARKQIIKPDRQNNSSRTWRLPGMHRKLKGKTWRRS